MEGRFKLIISGKTLYKEVELAPDMNEVRIGTSQECNVRLRRELFFSPIELILEKNKNEWVISCSDNLYLSAGDARKMFTKELVHGDEFAVWYQDTDNVLFSVSYMIDFDYEKKDYDTVIDIRGKDQIKIGGSQDAQICLKDSYLGNDCLILKNQGGHLTLYDNNTKYGVFVNGVRIQKSAKLEEMDFFSIVGFSFYYRAGMLYASSSYKMALQGLTGARTEIHSTKFKYPKFNRNSRVQYVIPEMELEIQQPVQKPTKPKKNIIMILIPALVMLAMTILLRGVMGGGGTFVIYSVVSMGMGIIMSVVTYIQENKEYKQQWKERIESYERYLEEKKKQIEEIRADELRVRNLIYESLENSIREADGFGRRLFERSLEDKDFLQTYLGRGRIESVNQVAYKKEEFVDLEDPLANLPKEVSESYHFIEDAPIISDLYGSNGVGIVASKGLLLQLLKNMTLDISIRHFYQDVRLVYILDEMYMSKLQWIRWLRNVENINLDVKNIVCDEESRNMILEDLYALLSQRENVLLESPEIKFEEQYVVFVTNTASIASHPVSQYFKNSTVYGFTFVFLEEYEEYLPQGCTEIIRIQDAGKGCVLKTENGDAVSEFQYPSISDETAEMIAWKLGAVVVDEVSLEGELTKNITLFELLGILSAEDMDLQQRWESSCVYKTLSAPLGVKSKDQLVSLNISDKSGGHGPHGLVAGTTGSGKSEILQTYILSMATLYHPYEVGFVLIDFKGGGMANQFRNLPHLIGAITNIDGREINRSLLSIKAELIKRQEMFAESEVNHINDYIKLYKEGKVRTPMPHLIMIVDEFAELKQEHPDFMKELISAARIGRTLGVHLILATQKPAGVVDAQIWSNSKFKLCLKVQTKEDSKEVLKTPLAAEIVEPGRAYFQVGNNEIFELFQSAYSGAPVPEGNESRDRAYAIYEKNLWGKKLLKYTNKKEGTKKEAVSQLQAIVDYVEAHCKKKGIEKLPGICLPSLKERISTEEMEYTEGMEAGLGVPVGIFDDPEQQAQGYVTLDPCRENTYIVGSAQMGKTIMLQTIAYGLIRQYTPEQINLYFVDCGSMVLKIFEDSVHVGGVVTSSEDEKCKNLFKMLHKLILERKKILSGKGVGNYSAYLEAGYQDMPLVVVIIDNTAAFKEYFPDQFEDIGMLSREALGVGISFIMTAVQANALNYRVQANFGRKIALNCNDSNDYSTVLGHCKIRPREYAGSGLYVQDKRILEFQTAIFGKSSKESERSEELKAFLKERNGTCRGKAFQIPMVPEKLRLEECMVADSARFRERGVLPIGMDFNTVEMTDINIFHTGSLTVLGDAETKEGFLRNLMRMISQTVVFHNLEAVVIDDRSERLKEFSKCGFVREYTSMADEGMMLLSEYCDEVLHRRGDGQTDRTIWMLVCSNMEVFRKACEDKNESKRLAEAIRCAGEAGAFIVMAAVDNQPVGFSAPEVLKVLKEEREAVLFAQLTESKMYEISGRIKADPGFGAGMGYRISKGSYSKVKLFD